MMNIDDDVLARIYSFDLQFSGGRRTKFYRELFGFRSKTTRTDQEGREKVYQNFYPGVLTPIPHLRLGKSVIAVPSPARDEVDSFFEDPRWGSIDLYSFDGILPSEERVRAMEEVMGRIKITGGNTLDSEIEFLLKLRRRNELGTVEARRVRRVVERSEELMRYDWTDESEFSRRLEGRLRPLLKWLD